ncbi:MAG: hypothetical protein ABI691_23925 [Ginsengibacter sp.]
MAYDKLCYGFKLMLVMPGYKSAARTPNIGKETEFSLQVSEYHSYSETIHFHIPRKEIELLPLRSQFKLKKSTCGGIETYLIYEGISWRLKRAQQKLEKKVSELLGLPIKSSFMQSSNG